MRSYDEMIRIKQSIVRQIIGHALDEAPNECCGLLAGVQDVITRRYPLRNIAHDGQVHYQAEPEELIHAQKLIRSHGETLLGIYHSHPASRAYPSPTDIEQAFYPDVVYFIVSLQPKPKLRAFTIKDGKVLEVEFEPQ
jgi:proteasome lid subunit RPN8/RPN11